MKQVYIVGGARTPIGKSGGLLKEFLPESLAATVLNHIIKKYSLDPGAIDQVILGNAAGPGGNIARVSALEAGWPFSIPALTVDFQCGSGLAGIILGASQIIAGQADLVIAGGVESTSMAPRRQFNPQDPRFQGEDVFYERAPFSTTAVGDPEMGEGAENVARLKNIPREEMDRLALESHQKAYRAAQAGLIKDYLAPVAAAGGVITEDEGIRPNISLKLLSRMPPVFLKDGSVTAGNTCLKHDGAAAVLLASEEALGMYHLQPEALLVGSAFAGGDPNYFPLAPVPAVLRLLKKTHTVLDEIDAVEINEAFAVKVLSCCQELGLDQEKTNILGGALAYGHPYGASGAIILLHLLAALRWLKGSQGIAAIGVAGGQGAAVQVERCG
ncbi:MAG: thiolase family protein [Bacillota bacterium]